MSGGRWNYADGRLCDEMFDSWYKGEPYNCKEMGDPMQDRELSELVWDVLGVIHDADYYLCSDICEETYRKRVAKFKQKWFGDDRTERMREIVNTACDELRDELIGMIGED